MNIFQHNVLSMLNITLNDTNRVLDMLTKLSNIAPLTSMSEFSELSDLIKNARANITLTKEALEKAETLSMHNDALFNIINS